eukprot:gene12877-biopygen7975
MGGGCRTLARAWRGGGGRTVGSHWLGWRGRGTGLSCDPRGSIGGGGTPLARDTPLTRHPSQDYHDTAHRCCVYYVQEDIILLGLSTSGLWSTTGVMVSERGQGA